MKLKKLCIANIIQNTRDKPKYSTSFRDYQDRQRFETIEAQAHIIFAGFAGVKMENSINIITEWLKDGFSMKAK
jgi:hypothetical protein